MAGMTEAGLRSRKKLQTRQRLEDVALDLFSARGFDAVTMDDIASAAEVGSRTVFRYFGDKAELVFGDEDLVDTELRRALRSQPDAMEPWPAVAVVLRQLCSLWQDRRDEGVRRRELIAGSPVLAARHLVKLDRHATAIAEGLVHRGVRPETARVIGRTAVVVFDCAVDRWLDDAAIPLVEALDEALAVVHRNAVAPGHPTA